MSTNSTVELLKASEKGNIKLVQQILAKKETDVNCKDIITQKYS